MQCPMACACQRLASHTLAGLCALCLPSAASSSANLHKQPPAKPQQPPQTTCQALLQPSAQAPTHLMHSAEAAFDLAVIHVMPRAGYSHTGRALCTVVAECCLLLCKSSQQIGNTAPPHKPPAQHPCRSPQYRPHHTCCSLQRLHSTLQCAMACPGLATHTLAGLCALWLPRSAASSSGNLHHKPAKPQHLDKSPAQPCRSPQCRAHLTSCALQSLCLTLQCPMACSGLATHTLAGLCALWLPSAASSSANLHKLAKPQPPFLEPSVRPCRSPQHRTHHYCCILQRLHFTLQCPVPCPGLATHTLAGLCALWLPSAASSSASLHKPPAKLHPPPATCPALPQPPAGFSKPHGLCRG